MIKRKGLPGRRRLEAYSKERVILERRRKKGIAFAALFGLLLLGAGGVWVLHNDTLRIQSVTVTGEGIADPSPFARAISESLIGNMFFVVPKNNVLFYPKAEIEHKLKSAYPEIASVEVKLSELRTLTATITVRTSVGVWCSGEGTAEGESCYALDEEGYLFAEAPVITGSVVFRYRGELEEVSAEGVPLRGRYISPEKFKRLRMFIHAVEQENTFTIVGFTRTSDGEGALEVAGGARLLVTITEDLAKAESNLASIISSGTLADPAIRGKIDYIDLRFGNKVYYRLKGGVPIGAE